LVEVDIDRRAIDSLAVTDNLAAIDIRVENDSPSELVVETGNLWDVDNLIEVDSEDTVYIRTDSKAYTDYAGLN
jgi:hypothetical protein